MQRRRPYDRRFRRRECRGVEHEWPGLRPTESPVAPNQLFEGGDFAGGRVKQAVDQEVRRVPERIGPL